MHRSVARKSPFLIVSLACLAGAASLERHAAAGPLKPQWVDADAQWLAHIDVSAMMKSRLVSHMMENPEHFHIDLEGVEQMHKELGLDPRTDVRDITVYGEDNPHDANLLVIVTATAKVDQVVEKVKTQAPGYREITTDGRTLFSFEQDDETMFFAVRPSGEDRIVFLARDLNRLVEGMDVVDGKAPNLASAAKADGAAAMPSPGPGSVLFAVINNMSWIHEGEDDPASTMLRKSHQFTVDLGEVNDQDYADLSLVVGSADDATNVADMLRGLMALGRMMAKQEPGLADLSELMNSVSLDASGNRVRVQIRQNADKLIKALHDAAAMHDRHDDGDGDGKDHDDHDRGDHDHH